MRPIYLILMLSLYGLSPSYGSGQGCLSAGENLQFIQRQTRSALNAGDINTLRYHTYKAIKAIETSLADLQGCGCSEAEQQLRKGDEILKKAAAEKSLRGGRILLYQALEHAAQSMDILEKHQEKHGHVFSEEFIKRMNGMPTLLAEQERKEKESADRARIDESLQAFKASLTQVIETVDCEEAHKFIRKIHNQAQRALERSSLSNTQRYYQEETMAICAEAMTALGECP